MSHKIKRVDTAQGAAAKIYRCPHIYEDGATLTHQGNDALLVRCGNYIYNVTDSPEIYELATQNAFLNECYKIGMDNGWCSGRYAMQDGDFITPEDRFNRDKFTVFTDLDKLEADFDHGNWCLGEAFVYGDLCFINQVDGGDEWLTIKRFETGARAFESITMKAYTRDGRFKDLIQRLEAAHITEDDRVEY